MQKKIVYIDMDDTICDYKTAHAAARAAVPDQMYPQAQTDFFRRLKPIEGAVESIKMLDEHYEVWILSRPSFQNPSSYMEKRLWVEDHLGLDWCKRLILCPNKGLLIGEYLVDDSLWPNFLGTQILFNKDGSNNWTFVTKYLMEHL